MEYLNRQRHSARTSCRALKILGLLRSTLFYDLEQKLSVQQSWRGMVVPVNRSAPLLREIDTIPLLVLACGLIVNSHLEAYYPVSYLAADGLLGNSLFFLMSGFGIQKSAMVAQRTFGPYVLRRFSRIYPPLIICVVFFDVILKSAWKDWSTIDYAAGLIWPTQYTYIRLIGIFYIIMFFYTNWSWRYRYLASIAILSIIYAIAFIIDVADMQPGTRLSLGVRSHSIHDVFYLQVTLLGGHIAIRDWPRRAALAIIAATIISTASYFFLKYLMVVKGLLSTNYWLLHVLVFISCFLFYIVFTDERLSRHYKNINFVNYIFVFISSLTLEIYLVHSQVISASSISSVIFPLNIVVLMALTLPLSWALSRASRIIQTQIER